MAGIIQSYGLLWSADNVFWGKGSKKGVLLGIPARARSSEPVDFRGQIGIYVLYDGHNMVYVGQAGSKNQLFARLKSHTRDALAGRWDHFSWFGLLNVLNKGRLSKVTLRATSTIETALNHIEAVLIAAGEPSLNRQGGRFGRNAKQYIQKRDERLGLTDSEMLRRILKRLPDK